jgi:cytochrome c-type biogenesis protein CcmE
VSDLDQELREAVQQSEAAAIEPSTLPNPAPGEEAGNGPSKRSIGLLVALLAIGGSIVFLMLTMVNDAAIYAVPVDKLVAEREQYEGRNLKVNGSLINGTLKRREDPCEYRFRIALNEKELDVRFAGCVIPDNLRDVPGIDVNVFAEGKLSGDHFEATQVVAQCPSRYEMDQRAAAGEKVPHAVGEAAVPPAAIGPEL